ncbi:MAG: leucine-rich repeat domain-containing protein, partial [Kiritimatiellia bacterium]
MKRIVLSAAVFLAAIAAYAETTTIGDYTWSYTVSDGKATITGVSPRTGDLEIPSSVASYPVTSIRSFAFYFYSGLTSVTIPDSVTSIGNRVFSGCSGLTNIVVGVDNPNYSSANGLLLSKDGQTLIQGINGEVTIPDSVTSIGSWAFYGCMSLTSVMIPDGVTSIGSYAFEDCGGLTRVTIPDSVTSIGTGVFSGCSGLTNIVVGVDNPAYASVNGLLLSKDGKTLVQGINGEVTIPDSVTSIGDSAFSGCSGLTSVTIPDGVTSIGYYAFRGCSGLTSVTIPDSVTSIGSYAFSGCSGLTSVTIPDSVTSIGNQAFSSCSGLTNFVVGVDNPAYASVNGLLLSKDGKTLVQGINGEVTIPDGVTSIGSYAFDGCSGLTSVTIPEGVTSIGSCAFDGCSGLTNVTIPEGVTSIGEGAFCACYGLTSVMIGDGVTSIGAYAFSDCYGLTSVTIPDSVTSIGDYAFGWCEGLTSVTIGDGVTRIGEGAFSCCSGLMSVTIPDSVTSIGEGAFCDCEGLERVRVPIALKGTIDEENVFSGCSGDLEIVYYDNHIWRYTTDGTEATITGVEPAEGNLVIPAELVDGYRVVGIGEGAFYGCSALTGVTIPESVSHIGAQAFYGCDDLASVRVPKALKGTFEEADVFPAHTKVIYGYGPENDDFSDALELSGASGQVSQLTTGGTLEENEPLLNYIASISASVWWKWTAPSNGVATITTEGSDFDTVLGVYLGDDLSGLTVVAENDYIGVEFYVAAGRTYLITVAGYDGDEGNAILNWSIRETTSSCEYTVDGTEATITGVEPVGGDLVIPAEIDGYRVTGIGAYAFSDCYGLTSVTIPDSVTSIGAYAFYCCYGLTSVTIPDSVTSIGDYAFGWCEGLTSVTIGDGVTRIGEGAFSCCSGLTSVTIPDSVTSIGDYAFGWCEGLTSVTIGDGVTRIGEGAFSCCSGLMSVTIPDSVTSIGEGAFCDCEGLERVRVPIALKGTIDEENVFSGCSGDLEIVYYDNHIWRYTTDGTEATITGVEPAEGDLLIPAEIDGYQVTGVGECAFEDCEDLTGVTIPDGVASIGDYAFLGCSGLTSVTIPDSVISIGDAAFSASGLTNIVVGAGNPAYASVNGLLLSKDGKTLIQGINGDVTIPGGVTIIGPDAFWGYDGLTSVTIPDGVISIGVSAFEDCGGLTSVTIPDSVISIGHYAFIDCSGLTSIVVGAGNPVYSSANGLLLSKDGKTLIQGINGDVTIPNGVTCIGDDAFNLCSGLTSVTIPDSVTSIGSSAFEYCYGLTRVTIPDSVTSIGEGAFCACYGLTSVTIPDSVTSIGDWAFAWCDGLEKIYVPNSLQGTFNESNVFHGCSSDFEIVYYRSIPAVADDADEATVEAAVEAVGFADSAVKEVIGGSAAEYN